jgi:hypothetical protein
MNLGQTMMVIAGLLLLGILVLNANRTVLETNDTQNVSEFGINAVSLATSLVEEANGKMFDEVIADSNTQALTDPDQLTAVGSLNKEAGEVYRGGANDFDDFDDFNNLFLVFKSSLDSAPTSGADKEIIVPGIRAKYYVRSRVVYVSGANLDSTAASRTWHKKIIVTVTSPSIKDTLVYPSVMSYWN